MKKEPNLSRRILIYAVMTFCMTLLVWLAWNGTHDSELHKQIADGCFWTMGMLVVFYVLGANIDNLVAALPFIRGGQPAQNQAPHVPLQRRRDDARRPSYRRDPDADVE